MKGCNIVDNKSTFTLIKSAVVNGINIDCYAQVGNDQPDKSFWLSREQIGALLEYAEPRLSVANIHNRNKKRLDKFSRVIKLITHEENRDVARKVMLYNFKGLLEICRYSNQPKANEVIDKLWDIADEIRRTGLYAVPAVQAQIEELRQENEILQAKCNALKSYIQENSSFTMLGHAITPIKATLSVGEAAKIFAQHNIKIGQNRLYKLLRDMKIVAKRKGRQRNQPTQKSIEQGLCVIIVPFGSKGIPYLTIKGLQKVANILVQEQFPLLSLITGADALHE